MSWNPFKSTNATTEAADNAGRKAKKAAQADPVRRAARAKAVRDAHKLGGGPR
jgi:hypothetical protein